MWNLNLCVAPICVRSNRNKEMISRHWTTRPCDFFKTTKAASCGIWANWLALTSFNKFPFLFGVYCAAMKSGFKKLEWNPRFCLKFPIKSNRCRNLLRTNGDTWRKQIQLNPFSYLISKPVFLQNWRLRPQSCPLQLHCWSVGSAQSFQCWQKSQQSKWLSS